MAQGYFDQRGKVPPVVSGVELVPGLFNETLPKFLSQHRGTISFANVDNDLYDGAVYILKHIIPQLRSNSVLHFHELLRWQPDGTCSGHDELRALFDVLSVHRHLQLELLPVRGGDPEPVLLRVLGRV